MLAASAIAAIPTLIFFLVFQRNIMSGLTAGSRQGLSHPLSNRPTITLQKAGCLPRSARQHPAGLGAWWRGAAIYQLYLRSFADGDGDGIGDLAGVRARLPYLADLGVDAIWFSPWYPSPRSDAGYDVADYRDIDPPFGTLADADALIAEAHALGIRMIIDIVPNHCSDQHRWFQAALAAAPGSAGARPVLVPARPRRRTATCRRTTGGPSSAARLDPDDEPRTARPASGTCTCSRPSSRTSTGRTPRSAQEFEDILRFWFDRGVDGIRIDSPRC